MLGLCVTLIVARVACADEPLDRLIYPLAKTSHAEPPRFELDLAELGDDGQARDWGRHAEGLAAAWYPILCRLLATDDWTPPRTIRLVMKKELAAPGVTSGDTIQVSSKWVAEHPDDFGLVIHELTHVVQAYPNRGDKPGWLVEGIADYIRYWRFEPERPHSPPGPQASYRDGYGTTGDFLAWLVHKHDHRIVHRLDSALRKGQFREAIFQETTGKDLDTLWNEYRQETGRHRR